MNYNSYKCAFYASTYQIYLKFPISKNNCWSKWPLTKLRNENALLLIRYCQSDNKNFARLLFCRQIFINWQFWPSKNFSVLFIKSLVHLRKENCFLMRRYLKHLKKKYRKRYQIIFIRKCDMFTCLLNFITQLLLSSRRYQPSRRSRVVE